MGMTTPSSERGPQTSRNVKLWFSMVSLIKARQQGRTLRKVDHCPTEEACAKVPRRILKQTWKAVARLMSPKENWRAIRSYGKLSFMLASSVMRSPAGLEPAHLLFGWKT